MGQKILYVHPIESICQTTKLQSIALEVTVNEIYEWYEWFMEALLTDKKILWQVFYNSVPTVRLLSLEQSSSVDLARYLNTYVAIPSAYTQAT